MAGIKDMSEGAMKYIHKLLLNTLYGRFGMNNYKDIVKVVSLQEYENIEKLYKILTVFKLNEENILVRYTKTP